MAGGITLLFADLPFIALSLVIYGAGLGIESIARGTVPLALFGAGQYATLMGKLALPSLVAQAAAPFVGALIVERGGPGATLATLAIMATANVGMAGALFAVCRSSR
jgi:hypothetical protein